MTVPPARRGATVVADKAARRIAERAAAEALSGDMSGGAAEPALAGAPGPVTGPVTGSVAVRGRRAHVALRVSLPYPAPLAETARTVQRRVTERTEDLTGLDVDTVRLDVTGLVSRGTPGTPVPAPAGPSATARVPRRRWASRRVPAAASALVGAVVCAVVTFDVVRVRLTHRRAAAWRTGVVDWLSRHGPQDTSVVVAGAGVALLGAWLTVLALTPGHRRSLTLRGAGPRCEAAVDRSVVAGLVRDAVGDVPGIGAVTVRAGRRRLRVRAGLAFDDRERARRQALSAVQEVLLACGLRRMPRTRLRIVPEPVWQAPPRESEPSVEAAGAAEATRAPDAVASGNAASVPLGECR